MGYVGVELAGSYGYSGDALRGMLQERGLRCAGSHTQFNSLLGDELSKAVEFNLALGNPYVIVPILPAERRTSRAGWLEGARLLAEMADRLQPHGLRAGYHNHRYEFEPTEGELPWDLIFAQADPTFIM